MKSKNVFGGRIQAEAKVVVRNGENKIYNSTVNLDRTKYESNKY